MPNWYVTRDQVKANLGVVDDIDDSLLDLKIEAVSRQVDRFCKRHFYVASGTRTFTTTKPYSIVLPLDLLSITTLKVDWDADGVFETNWVSTDFVLMPQHGQYMSPPEPFTSVVVNGLTPARPLYRTSFPVWTNAIQIVGKFGYYEVLVAAEATLNGAVLSTDTTIKMSAGTAFEVGQTILIESEQIFVRGIQGDTLRVLRGQNGTTAAAHVTGLTPSIYTYPGVSEPALYQVLLATKAKDAPTGMVGGAGITQAFLSEIVGAGLHPFVKAMLTSYVRVSVG